MATTLTSENIRLLPASQIPFQAVDEFTRRHEPFCVQLCERMTSARLTNQQDRTGTFVCIMMGNAILGVVFVSPAGLVLHCFPESVPASISSAAVSLLSQFFQNRPIYCISGGKTGTRIVANAIEATGRKAPVVEHRHYQLMSFDTCHMTSTTNSGVVQCNEHDMEQLYPLQQSYDKIEVLPINIPFNESLCRKNLLRVLQRGQVFGIRGCDGFLAKATVNANSGRFWQIGGVFTQPAYRGRGLASRLVAHIASEAMRQGAQTVLFVRTDNTPAIKAYKNAGFIANGPYEIVYY